MNSRSSWVTFFSCSIVLQILRKLKFYGLIERYLKQNFHAMLVDSIRKRIFFKSNWWKRVRTERKFCNDCTKPKNNLIQSLDQFYFVLLLGLVQLFQNFCFSVSLLQSNCVRLQMTSFTILFKHCLCKQKSFLSAIHKACYLNFNLLHPQLITNLSLKLKARKT